MMKKRWQRRHIVEAFVKGLMLVSFLVVAACLGAILWTILVQGLPALTWAMVTQVPQGGFYLGKGGGVLNAILGSLISRRRRHTAGFDFQPADCALP